MFVICGGMVTCHYVVTLSPLPTLKCCKKCRANWFGIPTQCTPVLDWYQFEFIRSRAGISPVASVWPWCPFENLPLWLWGFLSLCCIFAMFCQVHPTTTTTGQQQQNQQCSVKNRNAITKGLSFRSYDHVQLPTKMRRRQEGSLIQNGFDSVVHEWKKTICLFYALVVLLNGEVKICLCILWTWTWA